MDRTADDTEKYFLLTPIDQIHRVTARLPYGDAQEIQYLCA